MSQFRKKPVVIEAVQYLGIVNPAGEIAFTDIPRWLNDALSKAHFDHGVGAIWRKVEDGEVLMIGTLESPHEANKTDWIIRGVKGEIYPCRADIFAATYEAVELTP